MNGIRKYIFIYFFISLIIIIALNLNHQISFQKTNMLPILTIKDVMTIFWANTKYILIGFILAPIGISLLWVIKIPFIIGQGPSLSGIDPGIYYLSSFIHGLGELFVGCILFCFTITHFHLLIKYMNRELSIAHFKAFYGQTIICILPITLAIIFISAIIEVFVSNFIIRAFL
ncbi:hypothetical protein B4102_4039 [Heyndrickxia sporothermodurans]|uniref:Uncharacterized protein n=1 Tax=Heyndrickxia sporothermodurans TaxID=46224 RepID=A0A150KL61_9BACI|nr:hypothetical protein [Heyndrickxia sporothermodurans]KYC88507.1 hypothetical protein B4102_4039 [Heyndrickxia sporothermodurans]